MQRRTVLTTILSGLTAVTLGTTALAQDWPSSAIQVVVPFGAGGDTDFNARVLSKYLEPELGVSLPVINITGAGGTVAARQVRGAKPDGQTVLFFHTTFLTSQALGITDLTLDDYEVTGIVAQEDGNMIVVSADAPYDTMEDLMKASAADPGGIDLTANTGAMTYLVGSQLNNAGADFNFVDVGGASGRLTAVLGGNVDVSFNPVGQVKPYVDSGELKVLATISNERTTSMPDVPTMTELGYDITFRAEFFYLFPKGTPQEHIDTFSAAVQNVIANSDGYAEEIQSAYSQKPYYLGQQESREHLDAVLDRMKQVQF
jgi:tripartite-type tricarboxylate transporter receptor subunit TctC